jgi:hypothetical protein
LSILSSLIMYFPITSSLIHIYTHQKILSALTGVRRRISTTHNQKMERMSRLLTLNLLQDIGRSLRNCNNSAYTFCDNIDCLDTILSLGKVKLIAVEDTVDMSTENIFVVGNRLL